MRLRNILRFTLAAACSRNCEVESAPAPAHRIPKTGSIKVSKRCGGSFPAAIYLVERNAAHAAMRARTAMAGGVVPQGEAQKLTPMPNSPFCARWCKAGVWRPPLGRGQGRWRRKCRSCATGCSASTPRRPDTDIVRGRRRRRVANATSRRTRIIPVEPPLPPGYLIAEP
jgi:hypothetical protein